ncbi:MAG: DUF1045 domain-containing protein [Rhodobacteraceae bacterium]|nr:DUF1045 domain-containing protein [Paracoccaceae bacterium]
MFERYAIFYTPPAGEFANFGACWLGWNSRIGRAVAQTEIAGVDVGVLTAAAGKYGFHATLKAPFHLAQHCDQATLTAAFKCFAAQNEPVTLGLLRLSHDNGFLALRPTGDTARLNALAASIVRAFGPFQAPLSADAIARRRKTKLSPRQDAQMLKWGYPYVFEDFHFHMTLSGRIDRATVGPVITAVNAALGPDGPPALHIGAITLMGQDTDGMFHELHRAALASS